MVQAREEGWLQLSQENEIMINSNISHRLLQIIEKTFFQR